MEYIQEFATDCQIRGFSKHTVETYVSYLRDYVAYVDDPASVTPAELRVHLTVIQKRKYRPSTYNTYYAALNSFYEFLIYDGIVRKNIIPAFRKRYITHLMKTYTGETRQLISVEAMRELIRQSEDYIHEAIMMVLAKTGLRRGEFLDQKVEDYDLERDIIHVPNTAKRSRQTVFMDDELHLVIKEYLVWRKPYAKNNWMWIIPSGARMHKDVPGNIIKGYAQPMGLHDPTGPLEQRLTPHCFRHWFTTYLYRAGMDPQHIKWLRGDSLQKEAWQIYNHIDPEMVRAEYERCIPKLL